MSECQTIRMRHKKLCAGDMDRRICVYSRSLDGPGISVDYENTMEKEHVLWAALKTTKGRSTFYLTNTDKAVSHIFYIRYKGCVTSQSWVRYKDENYDIIEVENIDERDEWMALFCNVRGAFDEVVNNA